jgi:hypothetical protein
MKLDIPYFHYTSISLYTIRLYIFFWGPHYSGGKIYLELIRLSIHVREKYFELQFQESVKYMEWLCFLGKILLHDLKGAMRLDCSKDMSVHVCACFSFRQLRFQRISASCVEVVALIRPVCFYVLLHESSNFRATNQH